MDISIITPIYYGNSYLENLGHNLEINAKYISGMEIEWIIINDSPAIPVVLNFSQYKCINIRVINNKMNLGIQESRRRGVQNSTGRFVIFLDQDDMLVNDGIALQIQYIGKENAIMSNGYYEDKNKKLILLYNSPKRQFKINNLFSYFCVGNLIISPGMCMIKRSSIPKQWMEAEQSLQINGADDWLLWVDYLSNGNKFSVNDKAVYIHKDVGSNASSDSSLMLNSLEQAVSLAGDTLNVPDHYIKTGKQRIRMRRIYEGKSSKYKLLAFAMHPILALYIFLWKYK